MVTSKNPWSIVYDKFEPEHEPLREALCTLGNGYFATRGAAAECKADDIHYPGTYLAGGYNRLDSVVSGKTISNEDLVNFPNWLLLTFQCEDGHRFNLLSVDILSYRQELDMRNGILKKVISFRDHKGRETEISTSRIVHMSNPHFAAIQYSITPQNWSGTIWLISGLDGSVINAGVARYRTLDSKHLDVIGMGELDDESIYLHVQTKQSGIQMTQAARTRICIGKTEINPKIEVIQEPEIIYQRIKLEVEKNKTITAEKVVSLFTSRDPAIDDCVNSAIVALGAAGRFKDLLKSHTLAWKALWHRCDVEIDSKRNEQQIIRLHIFHLLQTVSMHSIYRDVGVPARGLHGEAYRGHIFWDELFIFPFYSYRIPEITRSLLLYRYHRLHMARNLARKAGYKGAMYPWQSGSSGQEETQEIHLNPRSNTWGPDYSRYQRHVNLAIVYNIWQYFQVTNNTHFLAVYGAEMVFRIMRFWSSLISYNKSRRRYEIIGVMGPDEYHEKYPNVDEPGLKNNAYTNVMVVWCMERALKILDILHPDRCNELKEQLNINNKEINRWKDVTTKMTVPFHDNNIISQFEGYDDLEDFDWNGYLETYGNIERLDRILQAEDDSPDHYKVSKQADVLMLFYLLSGKELNRIFNQLGYKFDENAIQKNIDYYKERTSHGSTLSKVVFASVLDRVDRAAARNHFVEALESDISDIQGGTTAEGIHLGAMAGTVDIVMRHYVGIETNGCPISFSPHLPEDVHGLRLRVQHCDQWYAVDINDKRFKLTLEQGSDVPITVNVMGNDIQITPGISYEWELKKKRK